MMDNQQLRAFALSILQRKIRAGWRKDSILGIQYEGFTGPAHASYLISQGTISVVQVGECLMRHSDPQATTFRMVELLADGPVLPSPHAGQLELFA